MNIIFSKRMNFGRSYRDRIGIVRDILEAAKGDKGTTKTRIMYKANLSHDQMNDYLRILTESCFIYYDITTKRFKTTEKGLKVIEAYKRIEVMVGGQQRLLLPTPLPLREQQVKVESGV
jgi:predicted transcriptional regulator